jgi:hypothetical protein
MQRFYGHSRAGISKKTLPKRFGKQAKKRFKIGNCLKAFYKPVSKPSFAVQLVRDAVRG